MVWTYFAMDFEMVSARSFLWWCIVDEIEADVQSLEAVELWIVVLRMLFEFVIEIMWGDGGVEWYSCFFVGRKEPLMAQLNKFEGRMVVSGRWVKDLEYQRTYL